MPDHKPLTNGELAEIRERAYMLTSEWESMGHMRSSYRADVDALLAENVRLKAHAEAMAKALYPFFSGWEKGMDDAGYKPVFQQRDKCKARETYVDYRADYPVKP